MGSIPGGSKQHMTTLAETSAPVEAGVHVARYLLIATLIAMLVSTSLTIGLEFAVYAVFLYFRSLRQRLWFVLRQPAALALTIFLAIVLIGTLHGVVSWPPRVVQIAAWRKALLFFFAAAVFDDQESKRELTGIYFAVCLIAWVLSLVTFVFQIHIYRDLSDGIVIHNYATQSFAFSIAAGIAAVALVNPRQFADDPLLKHRLVAAIATGLFILNIAFVSRGRSGYLALVVMAGTLAVMLGGQSRSTKMLSGVGVLAIMFAILAASGQVRDRVAQAIDEMRSIEYSPQPTSAGIRVVMWKNTLRMIGDHPVLGVGTGSFHDAYQKYVEGGAGWQAQEATDPHNQYLKIWAEQGAIGLLALLAFIVAALATKGIAPYRELGIAILLAMSASSFFNSHFSTFFEGRMLFFWVGALVATPVASKPLRVPRAKGVETSG
jgi:O-antigen ligase